MRLSAVQDDYRVLADQYDKRWAVFSAAVYEWVLKRLDRPASVLDLGCGTGKMLSLIHDKYPLAMLEGIDASREMLDIARRAVPQASLTQGDIADFGLIRTMPTNIVCLNVLHHLHAPEDFITALGDYVAALQSSDVFLCDFALDGLLMKAASLYWRKKQDAYGQAYSSAALRNILAEQFTIIDEDILRPDSFWRLQIYHLKSVRR